MGLRRANVRQCERKARLLERPASHRQIVDLRQHNGSSPAKDSQHIEQGNADRPEHPALVARLASNSATSSARRRSGSEGATSATTSESRS